MLFKNKLISLFIIFLLGSLLIVGCDGDGGVEQYTLTVSIDGGGVITSGGDILSSQSKFNKGSEITLTAVADDGWEFDQWEGAGVTGDTSESITITMNNDISITAVFTEFPVGNDGFFNINYSEGQVAPVRVEFDAPTLLDDNPIVEYNWDFDDGTQETTDSSFISHIFGTAGIYSVSLMVTDSVGNNDSFVNNVNVTSGSSENDIRITLSWRKEVDVDFHVTTPDGTGIDFTNTIGPNEGELDHDIVDPANPQWTVPYQENITWEAGEAVSGTYEVGVNYYAARTESGPVEVTVIVRLFEGSDNEIIRNYGPYTINIPDYNASDPDAWWKVIAIEFPEGNFSNVTGVLPLSNDVNGMNKKKVK